LSADYFAVRENEIKAIEAVLTVVDGKVVYGASEFSPLAPPPLPVLPEWSPVKAYGGYHRAPPQPATARQTSTIVQSCCAGLTRAVLRSSNSWGPQPLPGIGCDCFAF
jgi:hypothetical protein